MLDVLSSTRTAPALIVISDRSHHYVVNLTDRSDLWCRRRHETASSALAHVGRLMQAGHRVAFPNALRDLMRDALRPRRIMLDICVSRPWPTALLRRNSER